MRRPSAQAWRVATAVGLAAIIASPGAATAQAPPVLAAPEAVAAARSEGMAAIKDLAEALRSYLHAAMTAQGPAGAVEACRDIAPRSADAVAAARGLTIRRTALRVRNPANAPDAFETRVLQDFTAKAAAGADPSTLVHAEVVETANGRQVRLMKAIPMAEQPCAACHGSQIAPDVAARIQALYPADAAVGFAPGQVRGAFSITRALP